MDIITYYELSSVNYTLLERWSMMLYTEVKTAIRLYTQCPPHVIARRRRRLV